MQARFARTTSKRSRSYPLGGTLHVVGSVAPGAGAEIIGEPHDTEFGSRELGLRDPDGNRWSFGTYRGEPRPW
jgi:hypothetical protein